MSQRKTLLRSEVQQGKIYRCEISLRNVLVFKKEQMDKEGGGKVDVVHGKYFNETIGEYSTGIFIDHQLSEEATEIEMPSQLNDTK